MKNETQSLELSRPETGALTQQPDVLTIIAMAARDPNVNVDKMRAMLEMQERIEQRQAEGRFNEAFQKVRANMPAIVKGNKNPSTNSAYVKLEDVQVVVEPVLREHNFTLSFSSDQSQLANHYGVCAELVHTTQVDGKPISFSKKYRLDVPSDAMGAKGNQNKTLTHGMGSALSYGERYLIKMIFNLRFIGEDDDGNGPRVKPQGPSTVAGDTKVREHTVELWKLMLPVRGPAQNWDIANQWLWKNEILDAAAQETAPRLTVEKFRTVIEKVRAKLAQ